MDDGSSRHHVQSSPTHAAPPDANGMSENGSAAASDVPQDGAGGAPFHIVGIGASAGGLEAIEAFFDSMPPSDEFAFVIIQHLSPDYKSLMPELLHRHTKMPIRQAEEGLLVEPGTIYLNQPKKNLTIFHGKLFFAQQEEGLNLPIDIFFRSLAEDQGEQAVGVILSGTGTDGTRGIRAIKVAGGMVMVQDEESAQFDGMPKSATSTGIVDYVLPPSKMPGELMQFVKGRFSLERNYHESGLSSDDAMAKMLGLVRSKTGIDFSLYKPNTIVRRIERRMGINQVSSADEYLRILQDSPLELQTLFREILIGVTKFFRDPDAFETLKNKVLPEIFNAKSHSEPVRVWVAGCSTGEEAYSLAIVFSEYLEEHNLTNDIKIFSTDIDKDALDFASYGIYPESIVADTSMERLGKYFLKKGDSYQVKPSIREKVIFAYHNIMKDPPFARTDLVSCRNLLIYLQPALQKRVLANFQFSLVKDGYLFLGSSESVGDFSSYFSTVDVKWKLYRNRGGLQRMEMPSPLVATDLSTRRLDDRRALSMQAARGQRTMEKLFEQVISESMPPSVLVNEDKQMLHIFGDVTQFLTLPTGRMNTDITQMARNDLAIPLATGLQRTSRRNDEVLYQNISMGSADRSSYIDLRIRPFTVSEQGYFLVSFEPAQSVVPAPDTGESFDMQTHVQKRIDDLEQELQYTKESLQATVEEVETSNEELQATNEELLASNEELQSTNEELQSVNEELLTVNAEYQKKISELTELNDDMDNLMASTDIGTIFFDAELAVRKFTTPVTRFFHLIKTDVGRPLTHISHNLVYDEFHEDVRQVIRSHNWKEREVQTKDGVWVLIRIMPYRSGANTVEGVVVSFVDVTERKAAELERELDRSRLLEVLEGSPAAIVVVNSDGVVTYANREVEEVLCMPKDDVMGKVFATPDMPFHSLEGAPLPPTEGPVGLVQAQNAPLPKLVFAVHSLEGGKVFVNCSGKPTLDAQGGYGGAVFKLEAMAKEGNCDTPPASTATAEEPDHG